MHPEDCLKGKSLGILLKMTRVLRQSVVIDSRVLSLTLKRLRRLLTIRLRSEEDECRFIYILAEGGDILKHEDFWLYAGACGSRKTIVRFLSAHRASLLTALLAEVLHGRFICAWASARV